MNIGEVAPLQNEKVSLYRGLLKCIVYVSITTNWDIPVLANCKIPGPSSSKGG